MSQGDRNGTGRVAERTGPVPVEYHEPTGTYRSSFDERERTASEAVVSTVSSAAGTDPLDLPPVYSTVDPDALDRLFEFRSVGPGSPGRSVTFEYAGYLVAVHGHGAVEVEPAGRRGHPAD